MLQHILQAITAPGQEPSHDSVIVSFLSAGHKLQSSGEGEPQLRICLLQVGPWSVFLVGEDSSHCAPATYGLVILRAVRLRRPVNSVPP